METMATCAVAAALLVMYTRTRKTEAPRTRKPLTRGQSQSEGHHFSSDGKKDSLGHRLSMAQPSPDTNQQSLEGTFGSPTTRGDTLGAAMATGLKKSSSQASFTESLDNDRFFDDR
eukprot:g756.t1